MKKLLPFLKPYCVQCVVGPLFKLFEAVLELLLPTVMAFVINEGINKEDQAFVYRMGGVMLVMTVLGFGSSMVCQYLASRASQGFGTGLRNAMFRKILSLSQSQVDQITTSSLVTRLTNDINQLQVAVAMLIRLVVRAPFICIGAVAMAMMLDLKLSLILLLATPLIALILYLVIHKTAPLYRQYQGKLDQMTTLLREFFSGSRVIRAFAKNEQESQRFRQSNEDITATALRVAKFSALLNPLTTGVMNIAVLFILWMGAQRIEEGGLLQGEIIAYVNYVTQIVVALIVISNLVVLFTKAFACAGRVSEVLSMESALSDSAKEIPPFLSEAPAVEFDHVSFRYNQNADQLFENVSFQVKKGETVGIIGGTGSGKSSLVQLLLRFYDVDSGSIKIDGVDVRRYPLAALRAKIGLVPQKTLLFSGTVAENLRWGNSNASMEQLVSAAQAAQAHEFVTQMKDGYQSPVSRGGKSLSGGQRQRLTIARALVRRPEILILDDASSALDFATDAALRCGIKEYCPSATVFLISQRAGTVMHADLILVLDEGEIVGMGSHEQLKENCSVYADICRSQLS